MHLAQPAKRDPVGAIIFNALIIIALIPLALKAWPTRRSAPARVLRRNLLIYGLGGLIVPFIGIKAIDLVVAALHLALTPTVIASEAKQSMAPRTEIRIASSLRSSQ